MNNNNPNQSADAVNQGGKESRICKNTQQTCEYLSACRNFPVDQCNKPIPIKEFVAQSKENADLINDIFWKLERGEIHLS